MPKNIFYFFRFSNIFLAIISFRTVALQNHINSYISFFAIVVFIFDFFLLGVFFFPFHDAKEYDASLEVIYNLQFIISRVRAIPISM